MNERETVLLALLAKHGSLGNGKARQLLGWDEDTYSQVKEGLVAKGQVAQGRGRGGSIALVGNGSRTAQTASDAPGASTHRVDREGAEQVATGQEAHKPAAGNQRTAGPIQPATKDLEATGRVAEWPTGQTANKPESPMANRPNSFRPLECTTQPTWARLERWFRTDIIGSWNH